MIGYKVEVMNVVDLPTSWVLSENVRIGDTKSRVGKAIEKSLLQNPEFFVARNNGIRLVNGRQVVNGGTTFQIICNLIKQGKGDRIKDAKILVFNISTPKDEIPNICHALNNVQKVTALDLKNAKGELDRLKRLVKGEPFEDRITFKTGCAGVNDKETKLDKSFLIPSGFLLRMLQSQLVTAKHTINTAYSKSHDALGKDLDDGLFEKVLGKLPNLVPAFEEITETVKCVFAEKNQNRFVDCPPIGLIWSLMSSYSMTDDWSSFWERHGNELVSLAIEDAYLREEGRFSAYGRGTKCHQLMQNFIEQEGYNV